MAARRSRISLPVACRGARLPPARAGAPTVIQRCWCSADARAEATTAASPGKRAIWLFAGGVVGAVGLGTGATWAAYQYLSTSATKQRKEAQAAEDLPTWPIWVATATTFSLGMSGGLGYGMAKRTKEDAKHRIQREGVMMGARAFGIATVIVGAAGVAVVGVLRFVCGFHSVREFAETIRGGPIVYDLTQDDGQWPWEVEMPRYDTFAARHRLDNGVDIEYDLLNYSGYEGQPPQAAESSAATITDATSAPAATPAVVAGVPVVLLHGLNSDRKEILGAVGLPIVQVGNRAARPCAVLVADQRGCGGSTTRLQRKRWWRFQPGAGVTLPVVYHARAPWRRGFSQCC